MNPAKPEPALAASPRLSSKAAQFTESVIREMTRLALQAQRRQPLAGLSRFSRTRGNQARRPGRHRRRHQSVRHHLGREIPARRHRRQIHANARRLAIDPEREITVCCGSTEAMMSSMLAIINPGDEVVIFEPFYENYGPDAILSGATPRFVKLHPPDWTFDPRRTRRRIRAKHQSHHPQHAQQSHRQSLLPR